MDNSTDVRTRGVMKTTRGSYVKAEEEYEYQIAEGEFTIGIRDDQGTDPTVTWVEPIDRTALEASYSTQEDAKAAAEQVWETLGDEQVDLDVIVMDSAGNQIDFVGVGEDMYTGDE